MRNLKNPHPSKLLRLVIYVYCVATCLGLSVEVSGREVKGLYEALVTVPDRSGTSRNQALLKGLEQVITKITGSSQVASRLEHQGALSSAAGFVDQFGYQLIADDKGEKQLALKLNFSDIAVDKLLRQNQLPIWPSNRQPLLVWIVVDDAEQGQQLVGGEYLDEIGALFAKDAEKRGLPLLFPLMDLQDRLNLPPDAAWRFDPDDIRTASTRYQPDHWLVLNMFQVSDGSWRGSSWQQSRGQSEVRTHVGADLNAFLEDVLNKVTDAYSTQFTYIPQQQTDFVPLVFEGVTGFKAFKKLKSSLEAMEIVTSLELVELTDSQVYINVFIEGDTGVFLDSLEQTPQITGLLADGPLYRFKWQDNP